MDYETLIVDKKDNIATITLNRPEKLNTLTPRMGEELVDVFKAVDEDADTKVVVITGAGRGFCSGADFNERFMPLVEQRQRGEVGDITRYFGEMITTALLKIRQPVIAAINGPAIGFGCTVTLLCDIRIASEEAKFSVPFSRVGISPEMASTYFLPRLGGMGKACELVFTTKTIDAGEADKIGLVNQVVPAGELMKSAYEMAASIARLAPLAIKISKRALYRGLETSLTTQMEYESLALNYLFDTRDFQEATHAFLEKRPPRFQGK